MPRALLAALILCSTSPAAQQPQQPQAVGTGRITGQVVAADNGAPVKRAMVSLLGRPTMTSPPPRSPGAVVVTTTLTVEGGVVGARQDAPNDVTDEAGRFEFGDLTAGRYTIMVMPQGGFVRPQRPVTVDVKDAVAEITVKLERTGAITGRVLDESGDPLVRANVSAVPKMGSGGYRGSSASDMTDDLGQFRLFDLAPGDYYVSARQNMSGPPNVRQAQGYAATYFPGVASIQGAQIVKVQSGQDSTGIDFSLTRVPLGRITGIVRDSSGNVVSRSNEAMINVGLQSRRTDGLGEGRGASFNQDGTFTITAVPPGEYYVTANLMRGQGPDAPREGAYVPVIVNGDEQSVELRLNSGATIAGHVVIEGTQPSPPADIARSFPMAPPRISVATRQPPGMMFSGMMMASGRPVTAEEDGSFELTGVRGPVLLTAYGGPVLKSISRGAEDVLTKPLELKGTERITNITIVMTWEYGRVEGAATNDRGEPAADAWVVLFPDDRAKWFQGSPFIHISRTLAEPMTPPPSAIARGMRARPAGSFTFPPVLPGRYYVAAVEGRESMSPMMDEETLAKLLKSAAPVTVVTGGPVPVQVRAAKSF